MRRRLKRGGAALMWAVGLGLSFALAPQAHAADEATALRLRAESLAAADRCAEALPLLEQVRAADPNDARAALLQGQCAFRLRRYAEAIEPLEAARRLDPELAEANLTLAMALYHQGDLGRAGRELEMAAAALPDRAEVHLYRGLLLLQRAENRSAASELERAAVLQPSAVEPVASFYAGLAWAGADERTRALAALRRVREEAPGTPWADEADRALARIAQRERRRGWVSATVGIEYDDNVVLRGSGVQLPAEIAQTSDARFVWGVEGGSELFRTRNWAGGILAAYAGSLHDDLDDFDVHYPLAGLWLDRRLDELTFLRFEADAGYAWVNTDPFLFAYGGTASLHRDWGSGGSTRPFVRYARHNYLFPDVDTPPGPPSISDFARERNRDGNEFIAGIDHFVSVFEGTTVGAGYNHQRFDARGREYSYTAHEVRVGFSQRLPFRFGLDVAGSFTYRPYRHSSTFPDPPGTLSFENTRRRDDVWGLDVILERPVGDHVTLSGRWSYRDNDSNVSVFDYRRDVVGAYVTVRFDR